MAFPEYISDTQVDNTPVYLTSLSEIQRMLSTYGELRHTDDINPDDGNFNVENGSEVTRDNFITELVQRATSEIMSYLAPRYTIDAVSRIPRLREIATYAACHKLTRRRGNEPLYEEEYIEGIAELEDYRSGKRYLDAPSNGPRAYMQSYLIDNRFTTRPTRVIPDASTKVISGQRTAWQYAFAWL